MLVLGPLADNGGPTRTLAIVAASALLDGGNPADCPATDQRGEPRPIDGDGDGSPACDIGAFEAQEVIDVPVDLPIEINTTDEGSDTDPGDGFCWTGQFLLTRMPACSLRAAVEEANARTGSVELFVPAGVYDLVGDLVVTDDLMLTGEGREKATIAGRLWTAPGDEGTSLALVSLSLDNPTTDRFSIGRPQLTLTDATLRGVRSEVTELRVAGSQIEDAALYAFGPEATVVDSELTSAVVAGNSGTELAVTGSTLIDVRLSAPGGTVLDDVDSTDGSVQGFPLEIRRSILRQTAFAPSTGIVIEASDIRLAPGQLLRGPGGTVVRSVVTGTGPLFTGAAVWRFEASTVAPAAPSVPPQLGWAESDLEDRQLHGDRQPRHRQPAPGRALDG